MMKAMITKVAAVAMMVAMVATMPVTASAAMVTVSRGTAHPVKVIRISQEEAARLEAEGGFAPEWDEAVDGPLSYAGFAKRAEKAKVTVLENGTKLVSVKGKYQLQPGQEYTFTWNCKKIIDDTKALDQNRGYIIAGGLVKDKVDLVDFSATKGNIAYIGEVKVVAMANMKFEVVDEKGPNNGNCSITIRTTQVGKKAAKVAMSSTIEGFFPHM